MMMMMMMTGCWCCWLVIWCFHKMWLIAFSIMPHFIVFGAGLPLGYCSSPNGSVRLHASGSIESAVCVLCHLAWVSMCSLLPCSSDRVHREKTATADFTSDICSMYHSSHAQKCRHIHIHLHTHQVILYTHVQTRTLSQMQTLWGSRLVSLPAEIQGGYRRALGRLRAPKRMSAPPYVPHWGSAFKLNIWLCQHQFITAGLPTVPPPRALCIKKKELWRMLLNLDLIITRDKL